MKADEIDLLRAQIERAGDAWVCLTKMDTLPWRRPGLCWQDAAFARMRAEGAVMLTGSTLPFRSDRETGESGYMLSQRISNNFMILPAPLWRQIQDQLAEYGLDWGRFAPEATIEHYLSATGQHALRLVNDSDFRVFHTQAWGPRVEKVRRNFHEAKGIAPYLQGYQDDFHGNDGGLYMYQPHSLAKRARIAVGKWRRDLIGR